MSVFIIFKVSTSSFICLPEDILDLAKIEAGIFLTNKQLFIFETLLNEIHYIFGLDELKKEIY